MKARTSGILIGLLAVICLGLVLSVAYPYTTSDPHATAPADERFSVGDADAYSASGRIVVDGKVRLAFDGVVTSDGAWYQRVAEDGVTSERYRPAANGTVYQRLTITRRDHAERFREQITEDDDRTLVRSNSDGDRVTFVVKEDTAGVSEPVSGTASVFVNALSLAGYDAAGTDSSETVYEPRSGWYDGRETYRITRASGEVRVDAETRVVHSATVSWGVTAPAGTYAEYLLVRATSDDPTTHRISYELDPDDADLERPTWVDEAESDVGTVNSLRN